MATVTRAETHIDVTDDSWLKDPAHKRVQGFLPGSAGSRPNDKLGGMSATQGTGKTK